MGMMIGLLPKDSLFPYAILLMLLLSRANLLTAACSALFFGWISPLLDPISHTIGVRFLTFDPLESFFARLIQLPGVPWTRFDNSVVTGSLLLGLLIAIPVYVVSRKLFDTYGAAAFSLVRESRSARWLVGSTNPDLNKG